jgi:glycerol uptake facilitator-like aquaporin
MVFNLRNVRVNVTYGSTVTRVYFVVRRVPEGYAAPALTISSSVNSFTDPDNVLAYAVLNVSGTGYSLEGDLNICKTNVVMFSGDIIYIQATSDTSSTGQTFSALAQYAVDA